MTTLLVLLGVAVLLLGVFVLGLIAGAHVARHDVDFWRDQG